MTSSKCPVPSQGDCPSSPYRAGSADSSHLKGGWASSCGWPLRERRQESGREVGTGRAEALVAHF